MSLIDVPIKEAQRIKWEAGAEKYGPVFVGDPIEQMYEEFVDALNYVEQAEREGLSLPVMRKEILALCSKLKAINRKRRRLVA